MRRRLRQISQLRPANIVSCSGDADDCLSKMSECQIPQIQLFTLMIEEALNYYYDVVNVCTWTREAFGSHGSFIRRAHF